MAEEKAKRRGCGLGCLAVAMLAVTCIFLVVAAGVLIFAGMRGGSGLQGLRLHHRHQPQFGEDEMPRMREVWSSGAGEVKVARIRLTGLIMLEQGGWSGEDGSATTALRSIRRATADDDVKAILLEVDSPGGGITASDILYRALQAFKEEQDGRVVVTLMGDLAASGGYYVALASDTIVAHPTTLTGSIGVLMQSFNVRELAEKLGIRDVTIKSGPNKDMLNPLRDLSPAQEQMLQGVVDALHGRFTSLVAENRELSTNAVAALADGRVLLADQALAAGLIDAVGYAADAEDTVAELLDEDDLRFVRYVEEPSFFDLFRTPTLFGEASVQDWLMKQETRLLYKWPY